MSATIELTPDVESRLDALTRETGRTRAELLRQIVENGLEDVEDLIAAERAVTRLRSGESQIVSGEEIRREFGLDD